jgi:mersacidin/lichenicidin family type 2 lantibiotic
MDFDIVRAWKDQQYRQSLDHRQQALLPESPVGDLELSETVMDTVQGAAQGVSMVGCQFTGGYQSQCPTFGNPNGVCTTSSGPHVSHALALQLSTTVEICL